MKLHKLTCPNCGGMLDMNVADNTTAVFCPYCGQKFYVDDEKREYTVNKNVNVKKTSHRRYTDDAEVIRAINEAESEKRDSKAVFIYLGILFLTAAVIVSCVFIPQLIAPAQGKINAGYYKDLVGKDYKTVAAHFEAAGFTNIELIDQNDAGLAFWNNDKVDTISVGGNVDFDTFDWFNPDTKVVISYH